MGADLFESYVGSIIAAMAIGSCCNKATGQAYGLAGITFPMILAAVGILASIIGMFVRTGEGDNPHNALRAGTFGSSALVIIATFFLSRSVLWRFK